MSRRLKGWLILITGCIVVFVVCLFIVVPRVAAITLPYRWNNIPLEQPKLIVRQYLGRPADTTATSDTWTAKRESGEYELKINYNTGLLASSYTLYFDYHLAFFHKKYLLVEKPGK